MNFREIKESNDWDRFMVQQLGLQYRYSCPVSGCLVWSWFQFPAHIDLGKQQWWPKKVGSCPTHGRPILSSQFLAPSSPCLGYCRYLRIGLSRWELRLCVFISNNFLKRFMYSLERVRERKTQKERDLSSACSLPRWPQWLELEEASSWSLSWVAEAQGLRSSSATFPGALSESWVKAQ